GKSGGISGTFVNQGTISADVAGGTISLINGTNWSNAGTLRALNSGALLLGGNFATTGLGSISSSGGVVALIGTLTNTGSTLLLNAATGSWFLRGGTILGGTVATADGSALIVQRGPLKGVTVNGILDMAFASAILTAVNGLTLNGTLTLGDSSGSTVSGVTFSGSQTLGGTGTVVFGGNINNNGL